MHGAAIATSIGYGSMFVLHCWSARQVGFDPLADARLARATLATILTAVPIFALTATISNPWLALLVVPPVGFVLYLGFALLVGALDLTEPLEILSAFPDPVGSSASTLQTRLAGLESGPPRNWFQLLLVGAGLSLFASGLAVGVLGIDAPVVLP